MCSNFERHSAAESAQDVESLESHLALEDREAEGQGGGRPLRRERVSIDAPLEQLLKEARWIAQFTAESCVAVLELVCPDYRGLHVNLYDLLLPHEAM